MALVNKLSTDSLFLMFTLRPLLKTGYRIYSYLIYLFRLPVFFPSLFGLDPFILDTLKRNSKVVHIGASNGQERHLYKMLDLSVLWVEAIPSVYQDLLRNTKNFNNQDVILALLSESVGNVMTFYVTNNNGMSSSIFPLKDHLQLWPNVLAQEEILLTTDTLDNILIDHSFLASTPSAILILDTQGSELLVLKGAIVSIIKFRFIIVEAADFESYDGSCTLDEIDNFMLYYKFQKVYQKSFRTALNVGSYFNVVYSNASYLST